MLRAVFQIDVPRVSVLNPNETSKSWQTAKRETAVQLYLSGVEGDSADLVGARVAGFPISLNVIPVTDWIDPEEISSSAAAVVQVDPDPDHQLRSRHPGAEPAPG